jgi:hypothetical protein
MKTHLAKREFLRLSSIGGLAAAVGLVSLSEAEARKLPPGAGYEDLARLLTGISYLAGFALAIAAIYKFKQQKDNPTLSPKDAAGAIAAVWDSIDATTASWLTASGYSPASVLEAAQHAADGDTGDLVAFFEDLYDYLKLHPEP